MSGASELRKNFFPLPNEVFSIGLEPGAIVVYAYLLRCADRQTGQCWPSCRTIGKAVRMSVNTVRKYIAQLEDKHLISVEQTQVQTKLNGRRNGNLRFTIRSFQEAVDHFYRR